MRIIRNAWLIALLVVGSIGSSEAAVFDFDNHYRLPYPGNSADIEAYMESIYGSDIGVTHAVVGNGIGLLDVFLVPDPPIGSWGVDHFIEGAYTFLDSYRYFEISFNDVPITEVSFEWGASVSSFIAEADGEVILNEGPFSAWGSGTFSTVLDAPVTTLRIYGDNLGKVGIDDLEVNPVPLHSGFWVQV